jgi:hypothetical protein
MNGPNQRVAPITIMMSVTTAGQRLGLISNAVGVSQAAAATSATSPPKGTAMRERRVRQRCGE